MAASAADVEAGASGALEFWVNGSKVVDANVNPEDTLLYYLREKLGLVGTKLGCGEGGCGACTVTVSNYDSAADAVKHRSVNACLAPVCSVAGMSVTTVEGLGSVKKGLHPVQDRLAKGHGSQCGFCTPGFVMSMFTLLKNTPSPSCEQIEGAFDGNLCRCTGYRPILEAYKTFAADGDAAAGGDAAAASSPGCSYDQEARDPPFPAELLARGRAGPAATLVIKGARVTWYRPANLADLLTVKAAFPTAKISVGNTEIGVEVKLKHALYPVVVSPLGVPELAALTAVEGGVSIGASANLTSVGAFLAELVATAPEHKTRGFSAVIEMLRWFAGDQIRNVATIAGNVCTASPISDLNPILVACGATAHVASTAGTRSIPFSELFVGYRRTSIKPEEVLLSVHLPYTTEHEYVQAYKQARRREDDIAIVNACFRVELEPPSEGQGRVIKRASGAYGGMAAVIVVPKQTQECLAGQPLSEATLDAALAKLEADLPMDVSAPPGMVEYRRTLSLSLFFKYYVYLTSTAGCNLYKENEMSAHHIHHRPVPTARQDWEDVEQKGVNSIGQPVVHKSADKQVSGEAAYTDDIPKFHNELYGAIVFSRVAHAKLVSMDASEAVKMPGVAAFFNAKDVPGNNSVGPIMHDEEVFVSEEITCIGQPLGIVCAATYQQAQEAARAVQVEYEELPAIVTIEQAIEAKSYYMSDRTIQRGDTDAGFAACDEVLEGEVRLGGQEHFYLETQGSVAVPKGEDGEMEVFASTQNPSETQVLVATALGVPENRVVCRVKRMGGGFGGKETRSAYVSTAVAVAANALNRPVRCCLDRDEDMISSGGRHPFLAKYKVGFTKDGKVLALTIDMFSNAGNSCDLSNPVMERGLFHMDNCYYIPNIRGRGYTCKTNLPTNTAFRGFGGPQSLYFAEVWMSDVARVCGLGQDVVRELNFYTEGQTTHFNQELEDCQIQSVWGQLKERSDFAARRAAVDEYNTKHRWRKRGLAIIPTKFGIAFTALFMNQAGALIHIYHDGSVLLTHGGTEMGQGLHTKMIQVCANALGIPHTGVHISETSTATVPNTSPTAASASSDLNGMAILDAAEKINERLAPIKEKNPGGSWKDWVGTAFFDRVSLSATGFYRTPDLGYSFETNSGRPFNYFSFGAAVAEVEIDTLTGDHEVRHVDIVMDVGSSLNPAIDVGQVEGAFAQGYGLFVLEEMLYSPKGQTYSTGPGTYKLPGMGDVPIELSVSLLRNAPNKRAVHSSKAVGEPPLFLGSSVYFAIKDAVTAARSEQGLPANQPFRMDSPATSGRIRMACADRFTERFPIDTEGKRWNVPV